MDLSSELISQFVKATKDATPKTSEATIYGTTVEYNGTIYVKLDGSERLTPVETTVALEPNERVTVLVKNHTATVTGNISSPAARNSDVQALSATIAEFDTVIADKIDAKTANIELAIIDKLDGKYATFDAIESAEAEIDILKADNVTINEKLTARDAEIDQLKANSLTVEVADAKYATIENLEATTGEFNSLKSTYGEFKIATVDRLDAIEADIENLDVGNLDAKYATVTRLQAAEAEIDTLQANMLVADDLKALEADIADLNANKLSAKDADIKYATIAVLQSDYITAAEIAATYITASAVAANYAKISTLESDYIKTTDLEANYITAAMINSKYAEIDLANVDRASIGTVLANIGLITSATIVDGHVTGYLDSVEVNANNITAGTLTVDRLIISGSDKSIIYAINNAGELTSTETDTIDGDVITKRTIAADHIIAGAITANEIHSSAVTADKIATNAVTADKIAANVITSGKIAANAITADKIAADAVTADKINVVDLKALGATIGTFNIGDKSIYSGTKSTVSNTSRGIYMDTDGQLNFGDANNYLKFYKDQNGTYKLAIAAESLTFGASGTRIEDAFEEVQNSIDNIQVGGRNLLLGSATKKITPYLETSATTEYGVEVPEWLTTEAIRTYGTGGTATIFGTMGGTSSNGASDNTRMYSATIYIKNNHTTNSVTITGNHLSGVYVDVAPLEEKRVELVGLGNGWGYPQFNFKTAVAGNEFDITYWHPKIEIGNKPTDWTPAPEDVDAGISNAQSTAENAQTTAENAQSAANNAHATADTAQSTANAANTAAGKAQSTANNAQTSANNANNKVDNLQVGGRNLWLKTKEYNAATYTAWVDNNDASRTLTNAPYTTVNGFGVQRIQTAWADISQRVPIEPNADYTLSAWIKWESSAGAMLFYDNVNHKSGINVTNQIGTDSYKRVSVTFNSGSATVSTCRFECSTGTPYLIYGLKLEKGNKATDWTPAPEDVDAGISKAQTTANTANSTANTALGRVTIKDTRNDNQNPQWYFTNYPKQIVQEFKFASSIGLSGETYCYLETTVPWGDSSGGFPKQVAKINGKQYWRVGTSGTTWSAWNDPGATATNYMKFDSTNGLVISEDASSTAGNVQIKSDGFRIRNGTTVNASFLGNKITLGQNSSSSSINLCGDKGTIKINENQFGNDALTIMAEDVELYSDVSTSMLCKPGVTSGGYSSTFSYCHTNYESFTLPLPTGNVTFKFPVARIGTYGVNGSGVAENANVMAGISTVMLEGSAGTNKSTLIASANDGIEAYSRGGPVKLTVYDSEIDPYIEVEPRTDTRGTRIYMAARNITLDPLDSVTINGAATVTGALTVNSSVTLPNCRYYQSTTSGGVTGSLAHISTTDDLWLGYLSYDANVGITRVSGKDVQIYTRSGSYYPYYKVGDSFKVSGIVGAQIYQDPRYLEFSVPLSKPIIGTPTMTLTTNKGVIVKMNGQCLYGSTWQSYSKAIQTLEIRKYDDNSLYLVLYMSNSTNAVANSSCAVCYDFNVTLS